MQEMTGQWIPGTPGPATVASCPLLSSASVVGQRERAGHYESRFVGSMQSNFPFP